MGIFEDWFIGEILSFFAGEVEGTWHDAIEMNRRRKELEDFATSDEAVYYVLDKLTQKLSLRQVKNLLRILQHFGTISKIFLLGIVSPQPTFVTVNRIV